MHAERVQAALPGRPARRRFGYADLLRQRREARGRLEATRCSRTRSGARSRPRAPPARWRHSPDCGSSVGSNSPITQCSSRFPTCPSGSCIACPTRRSSRCFYVGALRKRVVVENLRSSFPESRPPRIETLARKFFAHLCDLIVESIKGTSISREEIARRHRYVNPELLERTSEGKVAQHSRPALRQLGMVALSLRSSRSTRRTASSRRLQRVHEPHDEGLARAQRDEAHTHKEAPTRFRRRRASSSPMGYVGRPVAPRTSRHHWVKFLGQERRQASATSASPRLRHAGGFT